MPKSMRPAVWQDVASALAAVDSMTGFAGESGLEEEFENSKRKGSSLVEERLAKRRGGEGCQEGIGRPIASWLQAPPGTVNRPGLWMHRAIHVLVDCCHGT